MVIKLISQGIVFINKLKEDKQVNKQVQCKDVIKMKKLKFIIISMVLVPSISLLAQTIVIGTGASIVVPSGADICAGTYGNITGDISGGGTECGGSPVPVELTSFTANVSKNKVMLEWETATEVNNYGFEIEKQISNSQSAESNWEMIEFIEGHGNSNSPKQYSFTDENLIGGSLFIYRLKQVDNDGTYEYSDEIEVEIVPAEFVLYQNYPNPFNPSTKIRYQLPRESKVIIKIYDILGSEVITLLNEKKEAGVYEVDFNASHLSSGTYIYRIVAGKFVETKKMLMIK